MAKAVRKDTPKATGVPPPLVPLGCALDCLHDKDLGALTRPLSHRRYSAAIRLNLLAQLARLGARVRGNVDRGREQWIEPAELLNDWHIAYWTAPARGRARIAVPKLASRYKYPTERVVINVVVESEPLVQALQHNAQLERDLKPAAVERLPKSTSVRRSARHSRPKRGPYHRPQRIQARAVLKRLYPEEYPSEEEVSPRQLWDRFCREWQRQERDPDRPSRDTVLREVGRRG